MNWRVDIQDVEQTIIKFCAEHPNVKEIACDPFRWQRSMQILEDAGLPIVEWPSTSARRMVPACQKFYDAVVDKKIIHDGNPTLARHLDNAVVKIDNLGPRIVKDKKQSARRIDAAVAAVLAFDRATVGRIEEAVPQFFDRTMKTTIQIIGAVSITIGAGLLSIPAGFIVGGVLAILIGIGLGR